jgi:hypothetical protein
VLYVVTEVIIINSKAVKIIDTPEINVIFCRIDFILSFLNNLGIITPKVLSARMGGGAYG